MPKMSKERKAIFAKHPWITPEQIKLWNKQLEADLPRWIKMYTPSKELIAAYPEGLPESLQGLPFNGIREHDGNLILETVLEFASPEQKAKRDEANGRRIQSRDDNANRFLQLFKRPVREFWDAYTGFDVIKFDNEIVKPNDGESTIDAIRRKWGTGAAVMIMSFLGME